MRISLLITAIVAAFLTFSGCKSNKVISFGFYNVENLFDTLDDPETADEEFLPDADKHWDTQKYNSKISHLSKVISGLCNGTAPDFLGLCEIENKTVIEDLIASGELQSTPYKIIHFESIDPRGIDVGAIYNSEKFTMIDGGTRRVDLYSMDDVTRDILWARMHPKEGSDIYFIVNHWPSRWGGQLESEPKRVRAAETLKKLVQDIQAEDSNAAMIILGDFNDEPNNKSIREVLGSDSVSPTSNSQLFNATALLMNRGLGSYCYRGDWNMLDQIIMTRSLLDHKDWDYAANSATIYGPDWMRQHGNDYEGYPLRTFGGKTYLDGFSDHFPVYGYLHLDRR
ncbi:MAG: endonuclease/exonuclease/phosphatase family protein [Bacteroidetes bacterium]|nr:endonuclease/exonuclease/phosphatase family protein [Bacteroidota bacterium]